MEIINQMLKPVAEYWLLTEKFQDIEGFLDPIEGFALYTLAIYGPGQGDIVEIGSLYGRSTCYLATGNMRSGRGLVYAVDTFAGSAEHQKGKNAEQEAIVKSGSTLKEFLRNIASQRLDSYIKPIVSASSEAATKWESPIRLLFIDGDHSYEGTKTDFASWSKSVVKAGLVAFHDVTTWDGVTRFYNKISASGEWKEVLSIGTLRVIQRVAVDVGN